MGAAVSGDYPSVLLTQNSSLPEPVPFVTCGDIFPHCGESTLTRGANCFSAALTVGADDPGSPLSLKGKPFAFC